VFLDYLPEQRTTTSSQPAANVSHPLPASFSLPIPCDYVLEFSLSLSLVFTTIFSIFTSLLSLMLYLSRRSLLQTLGGNDEATPSIFPPFSTLCSNLFNVFHSARPTDPCLTPISLRHASVSSSFHPPQLNVVAPSPRRSNSPSIRLATLSPIHTSSRLHPVPLPRRSRFLSATETSFFPCNV
jgi:hypothetical protein